MASVHWNRITHCYLNDVSESQYGFRRNRGTLFLDLRRSSIAIEVSVNQIICHVSWEDQCMNLPKLTSMRTKDDRHHHQVFSRWQDDKGGGTGTMSDRLPVSNGAMGCVNPLCSAYCLLPCCLQQCPWLMLLAPPAVHLIYSSSSSRSRMSH